MACVSGIDGAGLKERIVRIMKNRPAPRLDVRRKLLLIVAALIAVALPIGFGLANGRLGQANGSQGTLAQTGNALAKNAKFEVASIRQINPSGNHRRVVRIIDRSDDGRLYATTVTAKMLIQDAYGMQDSQVEGGPKWIDSEQFDVQAKADEAVSNQLKALSPAEAKVMKRHMVQSLLADRFRLTVQQKTKELPVYDLVVAKGGPKLQEASKAGTFSGRDNVATRGTRARFRPGGGEAYATFYNGSMPGIAEFLTLRLGRMVVDKTGITKRYTFTLYYSPELGHGLMAGTPGQAGAAEAGGPSAPVSTGPSIFTALQQQLGLKLKPAKGPVQVLVIDHIEQPTPN